MAANYTVGDELLTEPVPPADWYAMLAAAWLYIDNSSVRKQEHRRHRPNPNRENWRKMSGLPRLTHGYCARALIRSGSGSTVTATSQTTSLPSYKR